MSITEVLSLKTSVTVVMLSIIKQHFCAISENDVCTCDLQKHELSHDYVYMCVCISTDGVLLIIIPPSVYGYAKTMSYF